jgi:cardiolipin synthase
MFAGAAMGFALLADANVSTGFLVIAYLAIAAAAIVMLSGLFAPGLRYKITAIQSEDNTSGEFLHVLECLTDSKVQRAITLDVLANGDNFYPEELRAIAAAQRSVNLEAYILQRGEIAQQYVAALTERARAGVRVRVVLDGLGSAGVTERYFAKLKQAGGKVAWYNDAKWYKLTHYNNRSHREVLVIDGRIAFVGGAGIADHWSKGKGRNPRWRDTMVKVEGPSVANLQATFAENWLESSGEVLTGPDSFPKIPATATEENAALVVNSTPSGGGSTRARILFQMLIASARTSIHITTPYFLPDHAMMDELLKAIRDRGVEVKLLVPGKRSDHLLTRSSSRFGYGKLLRAGAAIFEYQPAMIHAKILLIDQLWGVVGSTNFDNRSFGLNDEVNLAVRDIDFVARLESDFARDLAESERITYEKWRRRSVFERAPELLGWVLERQQ